MRTLNLTPPCFVYAYDFADIATYRTTTTVDVEDSNRAYVVNDVIEFINDGIGRTITDINDYGDYDRIHFYPALLYSLSSSTPVVIHKWPVGTTDVDEDWHISDGCSPCIDAGAPGTYHTGKVDIDGEPRKMGDDVDMGTILR
ncbi:hypothetical protein ES703_123115 [subsurface metagenome]